MITISNRLCNRNRVQNNYTSLHFGIEINKRFKIFDTQNVWA